MSRHILHSQSDQALITQSIQTPQLRVRKNSLIHVSLQNPVLQNSRGWQIWRGAERLQDCVDLKLDFG